VGRPVEHLGEVAGLEGNNTEDDEADGKKLKKRKKSFVVE